MQTTHVGAKVEIDKLRALIEGLVMAEDSARRTWDYASALRARSRRQALQARLANLLAA